MNNNKNIDQLFEEQLGDLKVAPAAGSWDKLAASLDSASAVGTAVSKRRKKGFALFAFVGAVAAVVAYFMFFNQEQGHSLETKAMQQSAIQNEAVLPNEVDAQEKALQTVHKPIAVDKPIAKESAVISTSKPDKTKSNTLNSNGDQMETNPLAESKSTTKKVDAVQQNRKLDDGESQESNAIVASSAIVYETSKPLNDNAVLQKKEDLSSTPVIEAKQEEQSEPSEKEEPVMVEATPVVGATAEIPEENKQAIVTETLAEEKQAGAADTKEESQNATSPSPSEVMGIHNATGWSVDLYGGPAMVSSNESENYPEGKMIQQTGKEARIITPSMGIHLNYHYNNWFVRSGVGYAEYGENRDYSQKITKHDTIGYSKQLITSYYTYDTTGWIKDPGDPNVSIPVYDAIQHKDTSYSWVSRDSLYYEHQSIYAQNRFRYIEIPLMLGYEFRYKNFGVELATGVSVGFRVNSSGRFLDSNNELVNINTSNTPYSNTMMNYILSVGLKYHLGGQLSIIAQPVYKTNLNSLVSGSNSNIRYNNWGLHVGLNYIIK